MSRAKETRTAARFWSFLFFSCPLFSAPAEKFLLFFSPRFYPAAVCCGYQLPGFASADRRQPRRAAGLIARALIPEAGPCPDRTQSGEKTPAGANGCALDDTFFYQASAIRCCRQVPEAFRCIKCNQCMKCIECTKCIQCMECNGSGL